MESHWESQSVLDNEPWQMALKRSRAIIQIYSMQEVLNAMQASSPRIMSDLTRETIECDPNRYIKDEKLVDWILTTSKATFDIFLEALNSTCNESIANQILSNLTIVETGPSTSSFIEPANNGDNSTEGYIVVAGGNDSNHQELMNSYAYNIQYNQWIPLPDIPFFYSRTKLLTLNGKVYLVGIKLQELSTNTKQWRHKPEMTAKCDWHFKTKTDLLSSTVLDEDIYLCVKNDDASFYKLGKNSELKKLASPTWETRSMAALNGKVYSLGVRYRGWNMACFVYDPAKDAWAPTAAMHHKYRHTALVAVRRRLYAIGYSENGTRTCDRYNPSTDKWTETDSLPLNKQYDCAVTSSRKQIYAIGGRGDWKENPFIATVEMYCPAENRWTSCAPYPMKIWDASATFVKSLDG